MCSENSITAHQLIIRLCTAARKAGLGTETLPLRASIGGQSFPLTMNNFQVDRDGTLLITPPQDETRSNRINAARYRYLREFHFQPWVSQMAGPDTCSIDFEGEGHDLDAAIDKARGTL
ncbi:hypothetical protein ACJ6X8_22525 [Pseudomonas alvandae]|uniref:hypothetical protein n=1 Tax=Pseudomonas TaxID=286 RepID=UPI00389A48D2